MTLFWESFNYSTKQPVRAVGINRRLHIPLGSREALDALGFALISVKHWGDRIGAIPDTGLEHLRLRLSRLDSEAEGFIRVIIEPSNRVSNGVFFEVNDHFQLSMTDEFASSNALLDILASEWDASLERSTSIVDSVLESVAS